MKEFIKILCYIILFIVIEKIFKIFYKKEKKRIYPRYIKDKEEPLSI